MLPSITPLRMLRLCMKELRESLRDRRTIVTLVLMPLLVYPLLSLILNRVLLTNAAAEAENTVTLGIASRLTDSQLPSLLRLGYALTQDQETAATYVTPSTQLADDAGESPSILPRPMLVPLSDDGSRSLNEGSVDLVIVDRLDTQFGGTNAPQNPQAPAGDGGGNRDGRRAAMQKLSAEAVANFRNLDVLEQVPFDAAGIQKLMGRLDVRFRIGDARSERALQLLERMLSAVNNEASHMLLGRFYEPPFRVHATPIPMKSSYSDLLATMVPLVLVLMTMAGAVYPAIDLTAGERERGTMEALIVSPTPAYALLLAKYSAVVTVALLTALANLSAMTVTLWVSGIGKLIFGDDALSMGVIGTILVLLVLFTMFFASLLLAVTSFAKSFKEAQAYLIPLMLLALTPGVMSLLPGIKFTGLLATVPLVNIVLLAREILTSEAEWNTAMVAVICNGIYALAALAVASRLFGSDASMHGSQGSWRDLFTTPREGRRFPAVDQMAITMAFMFPLYFISSSLLQALGQEYAVRTRLAFSAVVTLILILMLPVIVCFFRKIDIFSTFRLRFPTIVNWLAWGPAVIFLAGSAWMFAHEIFIAAQMLGIGTISVEHFEQVAEFRNELQAIPLWFVLLVLAVTPAVCEEFLFRGFVLSSLSRYSNTWAIIVSAVMFGLMHVLTSNILAVERFLPTTFMGLILGFVAVRTGSLWPGILLHALHNGLLLSLNHYSAQLEQWQVFVQEGEHLPTNWLLGACLAIGVSLLILWYVPFAGMRRAVAADPEIATTTP